MQWQTRAASRVKDRWETTARGCRKFCGPALPEKRRQVLAGER
jgi:hypothetical protein